MNGRIQLAAQAWGRTKLAPTAALRSAYASSRRAPTCLNLDRCPVSPAAAKDRAEDSSRYASAQVASLRDLRISDLCFGQILGRLACENRQETAEIGRDLHAYAAFYEVRAIDT